MVFYRFVLIVKKYGMIKAIGIKSNRIFKLILKPNSAIVCVQNVLMVCMENKIGISR